MRMHINWLERRWILAGALLAANGTGHAEGAIITAPPATEVPAAVTRVLSDPLVGVPTNGLRLVPERDGKVASGRLPGTDFEHDSGVFATTGWSVKLGGAEPLNLALLSDSFILRCLNPSTKAVTVTEAEARAKAFAQRHFAWFFAPGNKPSFCRNGPDRLGLVKFNWDLRTADGLKSGTLMVEMRLADGKITQFMGYPIAPNTIQHKVAFNAVPALVTGLLADKYEKIVVSNNLEIHEYLGDDDMARTGIDVAVNAHRKTDGLEMVGYLRLDANTGKLLAWVLPMEPANQKPASDFQSIYDETALKDSNPVWTSAGLIFISNRPHTDHPDWAKLGPQAVLRTPNGQFQALTQDFGPYVTDLNGSSNSSWITLERPGRVYGLDLGAGVSKYLAFPERGGSEGTISSDGRFAVTVWDRGNSELKTQDLFTDSRPVTERWPTARQRRVVAGDQSSPVLSPDGQWLYFITTLQNQNKWTVTIDRLARADAELGEASVVTRPGEKLPNTLGWKSAAAQTIATLTGPDGQGLGVNRVSIYPSGQKLLVQSSQGILVVSLPNGKITPVLLTGLVDPETKAKLSNLDEAWAGPGENEVTFSAAAGLEANQRAARRIFSCTLDGKGIRNWTPSGPVPLTQYRFPQRTDFDAYQLTREWALAEIKWDSDLAKTRR